VGEAGPELFWPSTRGFVMDNADTMRLIKALEAIASGAGMRSAGGGGGNAFNLTVNAPGAANVLQDFAMLQALAGG
jgi:hypothetical protein